MTQTDVQPWDCRQFCATCAQSPAAAVVHQTCEHVCLATGKGRRSLKETAGGPYGSHTMSPTRDIAVGGDYVDVPGPWADIVRENREGPAQLVDIGSTTPCTNTALCSYGPAST